MKRFWIMLCALCLCFGSATALTPASPEALPVQPTAAVTARGEASVPCDAARVTLVLEAKGVGKTFADAQAAADGITAAVNERLQALGAQPALCCAVAAEPLYERQYVGFDQTVQQTGYCVRYTLQVSLGDASQLGAAADGAAAVGAQLTDVCLHGDDSNRDEAVQAAVQDALRNARTLAQAADRALGDVLSITLVDVHGDANALTAAVEVVCALQ